MKFTFLLISIIFTLNTGIAQDSYEPSNENPYGKPNRDAPKEIKDFEELIGLCKYQSFKKTPDGTWSDPIDMRWEFKYIMNGMAIQDQTIKDDGIHSGSIRQFDSNSGKWNVHYYTTSSTPEALPTWTGVRKDKKIILYKNQKAPNGMEGFYKISFSSITKTGFNWIGEWVNPLETVSFPVWRINCVKIDN